MTCSNFQINLADLPNQNSDARGFPWTRTLCWPVFWPVTCLRSSTNTSGSKTRTWRAYLHVFSTAVFPLLNGFHRTRLECRSRKRIQEITRFSTICLKVSIFSLYFKVFIWNQNYLWKVFLSQNLYISIFC